MCILVRTKMTSYEQVFPTNCKSISMYGRLNSQK